MRVLVNGAFSTLCERIYRCRNPKCGEVLLVDEQDLKYRVSREGSLGFYFICVVCNQPSSVLRDDFPFEVLARLVVVNDADN